MGTLHRCGRTPSLQPDARLIRSFAETLTVHQGADAGTFVLQLRVDSAVAFGSVRSVWRGAIVQKVEMHCDPGNLRASEVKDSNSDEEVDLKYDGAFVRGVRVLRDGLKLDTTRLDIRVDSATIERRTLLFVVPRLNPASCPWAL